MEQENKGMHPLSEEERAVFRRVWRRVMPEDRPDCPILLDEEPPAPREPMLMPPEGEDLPEGMPEVHTGRLLPAPAELPSMPVEGHPDQHTPAPAGATQPALVPRREGAVQCLGEAAAPQGPALMSAIDAELLAVRRFTTLARQSSGTAARTLAALSADARRSAKRLSTALFLISGIHFFPEREPGTERLNVLTELRAAFRDAQRAAAHLNAVADETADACLAALARELAAGQLARAQAVRELLEEM